MPKTQKVSTCLWFDTEAETAARFYVSLFENSRITMISRYGKWDPKREGTVLAVTFELDGSQFMALNGGPQFPHTEASSMVVNCDSQAEIDRLWSALTADGGKEVQCGWLKDRFGLSWQIVPSVLGDMLADEESERSRRVTEAMLQMGKLDIKLLEQAYGNP